MASGHVNRASRPNTWPHRPSCNREENPCQRGAVHTWHIASFRCTAPVRPQLRVKRTYHGRGWIDANDPTRTIGRYTCHQWSPPPSFQLVPVESRNEEQVVIRLKVFRSSGWEVKNDFTGPRFASPRSIITSRVSQGL